MQDVVAPAPAAPAAPRRPVRIVTLETLLRYLLDNQVLTTADLVDDPALWVEDRSRRNRNFKVLRGGEPRFMVKQAGSLDPEVTATLRAEADLLEAVAHDSHFKPIRWFSPRLVHYDAPNHVLVTELVHPATSLNKYHLNQGSIAFPLPMAQTAGRILANFHATCTRAVRGGYVDFLKPNVPFAFRLQQVAKMSDEMGEASRQFFVELRQTALYGNLPAIQEMVAASHDVVHGDVRWDNILLTHGSAPADNMNARLIDWELVAIGDAAWDVTTYLAEYVRFWLSTVGMLVKDPGDLAAAEGAFRLEESHRSANAFLAAYQRRRGLRGRQRASLLNRVALYLPYAVMMVAFEATQRQSQMPYHSRVGLRMAQEAYADPFGCLAEWFGLSKEAEA
jgi:aminoglycoside phosphotransferase (APT) family kinase protein